MTDPETGWSLRSASSLFGFAPGGVYNAISVARNAVGSYPTLSPLPRQHSCPPDRFIETKDRNAGGAVSFLWHFPWGHPRRTLSGTVFPWSPDFPPSAVFRHCKERLSGQLARPDSRDGEELKALPTSALILQRMTTIKKASHFKRPMVEQFNGRLSGRFRQRATAAQSHLAGRLCEHRCG